MEQLIIFLLFVVGSIISSIIQHKKKQAEEQQQRELEEMTRRSGSGRPPVAQPRPSLPTPGPDWQEQLRRILQGETGPQPPPVIKPVLLPPVQKQSTPPVQRTSRVPASVQTREPSEGDLVLQSPLRTSAVRYERASNLHAAVEERMRAVSDQTVTHKEAAPQKARKRAHSEFVNRLRRDPRAIREGFIASLIFGPPKGLQSATAETQS